MKTQKQKITITILAIMIFIITVVIILAVQDKKDNTVQENSNNKIISETKKDVAQYLGWKKYCSEKFRFEIQYPKNWINDIYAHTPEKNLGYQFFANSNEKPQKRSYFDIFTTNKDMVINASAIKEKKNMKLLGYDAISYTFTDNDKRIIFKKDDTFFHITIDNITAENKTILDDIFSSFRFLSDSEKCQEVNKPGTTILGHKIYYYGTEIGSFNNGKIYISFQGNIYSFSGNPEYFTKHEMVEGVYFYKGISINLPNNNRKEPEIIYKCTSSLLPSKPYFYCDTNGKNYLTQYEFGRNYRQFSTGGGFPLKWKKIYIKNIDGKNIVFEGVLAGDAYCPLDPPNQTEIQRIKSKECLDKINQSTSNKENEKEWKTLVESFLAEKE